MSTRRRHARIASHDHYPTPKWATEALLAHAEAQGWLASGSTVLDPAAGEGAILDVAHQRGHRTHGIELQPQLAAAARRKGHKVRQGDALSVPWPACDAVITNPPYSYQEAFLAMALAYAAPGRRVCALLRLSFLGSARRADFHRQHPAWVLVLPRRPSFDGQGTDSADSAWFVWPGEGRLVWLP
jgi:hypothetical protein